MPRFVALIDGAPTYAVSFPDVPGVTAAGSTLDEAVENACRALREWAADPARRAALPAPHDLAVLRRQRDIRLALGRGAVLALIPLVVATGRAVKANLSIDDGLLAAIDDAAERLGVTRSAFLAAAAREKIAATS